MIATFLFVWSVTGPGGKVSTLRGDAPFYARCADARAAGAAPLYLGEPGYRPGLDADGDGIACEPLR